MTDHDYYRLTGDILSAVNKLQLAKTKVDFMWEENPLSPLKVAELCGEAARISLEVAQAALAEVKIEHSDDGDAVGDLSSDRDQQ